MGGCCPCISGYECMSHAEVRGYLCRVGSLCAWAAEVRLRLSGLCHKHFCQPSHLAGPQQRPPFSMSFSIFYVSYAQLQYTAH